MKNHKVLLLCLVNKYRKPRARGFYSFIDLTPFPTAIGLESVNSFSFIGLTYLPLTSLSYGIPFQTSRPSTILSTTHPSTPLPYTTQPSTPLPYTTPSYILADRGVGRWSAGPNEGERETHRREQGTHWRDPSQEWEDQGAGEQTRCQGETYCRAGESC